MVWSFFGRRKGVDSLEATLDSGSHVPGVDNSITDSQDAGQPLGFFGRMYIRKLEATAAEMDRLGTSGKKRFFGLPYGDGVVESEIGNPARTTRVTSRHNQIQPGQGESEPVETLSVTIGKLTEEAFATYRSKLQLTPEGATNYTITPDQIQPKTPAVISTIVIRGAHYRTKVYRDETTGQTTLEVYGAIKHQKLVPLHSVSAKGMFGAAVHETYQQVVPSERNAVTLEVLKQLQKVGVVAEQTQPAIKYVSYRHS